MSYSKVDVTTQATGTVIPESNSTTIDTMVDGQIDLVNVKLPGRIATKDLFPGIGAFRG